MSEPIPTNPPAVSDCCSCADTAPQTPAPVWNREGLQSIAYRAGTHADFKASLLAALSRLSASELQALRRLHTRDGDDFTIALLDSWAAVADVLMFYQERIATESFLRTATERRSVLHLARLIGYELRPGVAASACLAFTLEDAPGAPAQTTIVAGAKAQSVPGPGEKPQTFETVEQIEARAEWNALRPRLTSPAEIKGGVTRGLFLKGTGTALQPGDAILIVGDERLNHPKDYPFKEQWDVRVLQTVTAHADQGCTHVTWEKPLGRTPIPPAARNVRVFAFRQRAALFGNNAPDPRMLKLDDATQKTLVVGSGVDLRWKNFTIRNGEIDLDASYPRIVANSWVALSTPTPPPKHPALQGYVELFKVSRVSHPSRADFALSSKITRLVPDTTEHLDGDWFTLRETLVFAQSEELALAEMPFTTPVAGAPCELLPLEPGLLTPVEGNTVALDRAVPGWERGRKLVVTGKRLRARPAPDAPQLKLAADDGTRSTPLQAGESLLVLDSPFTNDQGQVTWHLRRHDGFEGRVTTARGSFILAPAESDDAPVSEVVLLQEAEGTPATLHLQSLNPQSPPLRHSYDRATVTLCANVASATHGETVAEEVLGGGDATQPHQKFALRQAPLTWLRSETPAGVESTLQLRVNGLLWHDVPALYGHGPRERVFVTRLSDDGQTTVHFGDGRNGARLPTGADNVRAVYRKGGGLDGLVKARQLSLLLTRPLGVKSVANPLPAEGADAPEPLADARRNAPLTVLTLDRVVSLQDYENFAAAYPGIGKALATWTWDGRSQGIFLTVAGPRGDAIPEDGAVITKLLQALRAAGDPHVRVRARPHRPAWFRIAGTVRVDSGFAPDRVLAAVKARLGERYSFEARAFGQAVFLSEVMAAIHEVAGVVAVDVDRLERGANRSGQPPRDLPSAGPAAMTGAAAFGAELLLLAPDGLDELEAQS